MQWLGACCWINEWRNRQFNKQTNETINLRVEWNFRGTGTPEDPSEIGSISSLRHQSPELISSVPCPFHRGHATALPFPGDPDSLLSSLCVWGICDFTVSMVFLMKSKWCPMWLGKMHKQQQNYMFFFPVVFTGRVRDLFAVNTAYNDMVQRSAAKSVRHSLHTCIKCNAIEVWRLSHWAECCPEANAELLCLFPQVHDGVRGEWIAVWVAAPALECSRLMPDEVERIC